MWPTFYIPGFNLTPAVIPPEVDHKCGVLSTGGTPVSVPNPDSLENGDTQLLIISYVTNSTIVWPGAADGWREVFDSVKTALPLLGSNYGFTQVAATSAGQKIFLRQFSTGDTNFSLYVTGGGFVSWAYAMMSLGNPEPTDPFFSAYWTMESATPRYSDAPSGAAQYMEVANEGDLLVKCSSPGANLSALDEPDSADVEFACTNTTTFGAGPYNGHTMSAAAGYSRANNFLRYSDTFDPSGWTNVNMSRDTTAVYSTSSKGRVEIRPTTANGKHYFEQSVDLEAGKSYLFSVAFFGNNTSSAYIWQSYEKPDTTEHGAGSSMDSSSRLTLAGSTEVNWATKGTVFRTQSTGNTLGIFGGIQSVMIDADTTGTYKLRVHVTGGTDPNTAHVGDTSDWVQVSAVSLVQGPVKQQQPTFLPTTSTAILPGTSDYFLPTPPINTGTRAETSGWTNIVVRRSGGKRPLCKLFNPGTRHIYADFSNNGIVDSRIRMSPEAEGETAMTTSHIVYDLLANQKFYFELYVDSFGTGGANDVYSIGACPFEAANVVIANGATLSTGDWDYQHAYTATGKTFTSGTQDGGTVTGWSAGDYIGCGIDFANSQVTFYRNGTLLKTQAMVSALVAAKFWVGLFGFYSAYAADKQARFTYNFRGPFGGRKPSGFYALDFDNELT